MIKITIVYAMLLIALGVGAFISSTSPTALLPAYVGGALLLVGGLAFGFESARKLLARGGDRGVAWGVSAGGGAGDPGGENESTGLDG